MENNNEAKDGYIMFFVVVYMNNVNMVLMLKADKNKLFVVQKTLLRIELLQW